MTKKWAKSKSADMQTGFSFALILCLIFHILMIEQGIDFVNDSLPDDLNQKHKKITKCPNTTVWLIEYIRVILLHWCFIFFGKVKD